MKLQQLCGVASDTQSLSKLDDVLVNIFPPVMGKCVLKNSQL